MSPFNSPPTQASSSQEPPKTRRMEEVDKNDIERFKNVEDPVDRISLYTQFFWRVVPSTNDNFRGIDDDRKKDAFLKFKKELTLSKRRFPGMISEFEAICESSGFPWDHDPSNPKGEYWTKFFMQLAVQLRWGQVKGEKYTWKHAEAHISEEIYAVWESETYQRWLREATRYALAKEDAYQAGMAAMVPL